MPDNKLELRAQVASNLHKKINWRLMDEMGCKCKINFCDTINVTRPWICPFTFVIIFPITLPIISCIGWHCCWRRSSNPIYPPCNFLDHLHLGWYCRRRRSNNPIYHLPLWQYKEAERYSSVLVCIIVIFVMIYLYLVYLSTQNIVSFKIALVAVTIMFFLTSSCLFVCACLCILVCLYVPLSVSG